MSVIDQVTTEGDQAEESQNLLDQLVGEGKRYASTDALAKGRLEADEYIKRLESENKDMRDAFTTVEEESKRAATVDELLAEVRNKASSKQPQAAMSEADVKTTVEELYNQQRTNEQRAANKSRADAAILAKFSDPDSATSHVKKRIKELGLSAEKVKDLSETSPDAFVALMALESVKPEASTSFYEKQTTQTPLETSDDGRRNHAYYQRKRAEMGMSKFYGDKALQAQKFKDANEQGASYFK